MNADVTLVTVEEQTRLLNAAGSRCGIHTCKQGGHLGGLPLLADGGIGHDAHPINRGGDHGRVTLQQHDVPRAERHHKLGNLYIKLLDVQDVVGNKKRPNIRKPPAGVVVILRAFLKRWRHHEHRARHLRLGKLLIEVRDVQV